MSRVISEKNFQRIQRVAVPLVDTLDTALERILDSYERTVGITSSAAQPGDTEPGGHGVAIRDYDPFDPPNLTHTKLTNAIVADKVLRSPSWNSMLDEVVVVARNRIGDFATLQGMFPINIFKGDKSDEGYHFLKEVGLSVQGQSANDAWRGVATLARQIGCDVQANFFWRQKKGALKPGENGRFVVKGLG
jgi:hypothetical protein